MGEEKEISQELEKQNTLKDVIDQVQEILKMEDLPEKAATALKKVADALTKLNESYGYGYPAPEKTEKRGNKFSKENAERIRKIYEIAKELVDQIEALNEEDDAGKAPWDVQTSSEYLAKCIDLVNEITEKLGGKKNG